MKTRFALKIGLGFVFLATSIGCSHMHRVVNKGDAMLYGVTVQSGGRTFGHGYLPPNAIKGYSGSMSIRRSPPPTISWRATEHGEIRSQAVLLDAYPLWREVVFELDGKTVKGKIREPSSRLGD